MFVFYGVSFLVLLRYASLLSLTRKVGLSETSGRFYSSLDFLKQVFRELWGNRYYLSRKIDTRCYFCKLQLIANFIQLSSYVKKNWSLIYNSYRSVTGVCNLFW